MIMLWVWKKACTWYYQTLLHSFIQWFWVSGALFLSPFKGIPPPQMNWSAVHTNTVYSSGFELCLLRICFAAREASLGFGTGHVPWFPHANPWSYSQPFHCGFVLWQPSRVTLLIYFLFFWCVSETRHLIVPFRLWNKFKKHELWIWRNLVALHLPEISTSFPDNPSTLPCLFGL